MKKYEVINETGLVLEGSEEVHAKGSIVELDPEDQVTKDHLGSDVIKEVVEENSAVVTEEYLTAHPDSALKIGDPIPADDASEKKEEFAKEEEAPAASDEPRKRYRGSVVLEETDRTVGAQTFKHIKTAEGHEYDLTDAEYTLEVHVSYPPQS